MARPRNLAPPPRNMKREREDAEIQLISARTHRVRATSRLIDSVTDCLLQAVKLVLEKLNEKR